MRSTTPRRRRAAPSSSWGVSVIRGDTDGCQLSDRGPPCPNVGADGHGFHGPLEHITVGGMDLATSMCVELVRIHAKR